MHVLPAELGKAAEKANEGDIDVVADMVRAAMRATSTTRRSASAGGGGASGLCEASKVKQAPRKQALEATPLSSSPEWRAKSLSSPVAHDQSDPGHGGSVGHANVLPRVHQLRR